MPGDPMIRFEHVTKQYGSETAVDDVSFTVSNGEFLALLGPSGSGKSTTLRMLAGFESPTAGAIHLDGADLAGVPPHKRDTSMVFQNYALFPHMTVGENVGYGLKRQGMGPSEIERRVEETLELVDLGELEDRAVDTLSGGQQQRVATARSLAVEPRVLLMDEPLGALDKQLRERIQIDLSRLLNRLDITTIYVTHNQEEALTMADRIAVMNEGRIEQLGTPTEIYHRPQTRFISDFIGDANFIEGTLRDRDGSVVLEAHGVELAVAADSWPRDDGLAFVRPERISIVDAPAPDQNALSGTVEQVVFMGDTVRYFIDVDGTEFVVDQDEETVGAGTPVTLAWSPSDTKLIEA